ncbi:protein boule-like [Cololabis saira]|uniref:protein boule-like n=1 Tax=Cololabis saira TaxID=129043 RepID=UPI002AD3DB22|nr:protein boule-like [Cololabis saira]
MDVENQNREFMACPSSFNLSRSSPPFDVFPAESQAHVLIPHAPSTIIPNRIFVGGIDFKVNENDLRTVFSQHGEVKEVKIVIDRSGMSKGYGFVTFETQEDVLKILNNVNGIFFKDKKLCIGQAVRKHQTSRRKDFPMLSPEPVMSHQMSHGGLHLTTSTGYPYTYHNGVAYFSYPSVNAPAHRWSPGSQLMCPQSNQPVQHQQPAYHYYQMPMSSSAVGYSQQSEYLYQPADGGYFQHPVPVMEETTPESLTFPPLPVHLKPKYHPYMHHKDYYYVPEPTGSPETAVFHTSQPPM